MLMSTVKIALESWDTHSVPPGLESFLALHRALERWAMLGRPSEAEFSIIPLHWIESRRVSRTLKRKLPM